jgi:hypothetical protein
MPWGIPLQFNRQLVRASKARVASARRDIVQLVECCLPFEFDSFGDEQC